MSKLLIFLILSAMPIMAQPVKFIALTAASGALTVADAVATNRCVSNHTCREGNPLLPQANGPRTALMLGEFGAETWASWWMRRHHMKEWVAVPMIGVVTHGIGVGITLNR